MGLWDWIVHGLYTYWCQWHWGQDLQSNWWVRVCTPATVAWWLSVEGVVLEGGLVVLDAGFGAIRGAINGADGVLTGGTKTVVLHQVTYLIDCVFFCL